MYRAITGAFAFLLIILVLRAALPGIADLIIEIITKTLSMINDGLDFAINQLPK